MAPYSKWGQTSDLYAASLNDFGQLWILCQIKPSICVAFFTTLLIWRVHLKFWSNPTPRYLLWVSRSSLVQWMKYSPSVSFRLGQKQITLNLLGLKCIIHWYIWFPIPAVHQGALVVIWCLCLTQSNLLYKKQNKWFDLIWFESLCRAQSHLQRVLLWMKHNLVGTVILY